MNLSSDRFTWESFNETLRAHKGLGEVKEAFSIARKTDEFCAHSDAIERWTVSDYSGDVHPDVAFQEVSDAILAVIRTFEENGEEAKREKLAVIFEWRGLSQHAFSVVMSWMEGKRYVIERDWSNVLHIRPKTKGHNPRNDRMA